ncbi:MAG: ATP-binding protein [bacterium]|nr:ATP-binding protein [bacterium]
MILSVASGKGGTGKTTVAVSLALARRAAGAGAVRFLDCDVEEPNARIFLKPEIEGRREVRVPVPVADESKCTGCGLCAEVCAYHAIMVNRKSRQVFVFPELCHGCGACTLLCPAGALSETGRVTGVVEWGPADGILFADGTLRVGEAMSPPLIRAVKELIRPDGDTIIDCPPGTSCPVVQAVRKTDFCLLVTEPTPFGLNDLALAVEMVRALDVPMGVVINQADIGGGAVRDYCAAAGIPVLLEIPHDRRIATNYARGIPAFRAGEAYARLFLDLQAAVWGGRAG